MKTSIVINGHPLTDDQVAAVTAILNVARNQLMLPEAFGKPSGVLRHHKESIKEVTQMYERKMT